MCVLLERVHIEPCWKDGPALLQQFIGSAPDQRGHMQEVVDLLQPASVSELVEKLQYGGRLQHMSCWLCFGHGLPVQVADGVPVARLREWRSAALAFQARYGWAPNPVPLMMPDNLVPRKLRRLPDAEL